MKNAYYYKENNEKSVSKSDHSLTLHREDGPALHEETKWDQKIIVTQKYYKDGNLHREGDEPAVLEFFKGESTFLLKKWFKDGDMHRNHGPSTILYDMEDDDRAIISQQWFIDGFPRVHPRPYYQSYDNGAVREEKYFYLNRIHEGIKPAMISFRGTKDKKVYSEKIWPSHIACHEDDEEGLGYYLSKDDGPSVLSYNEYGDLLMEQWFKDGASHRDGAPALSCYGYKEGIRYISNIMYYVNNLLHREDGPADIEYNFDGSIISEEWWLEGVKLNK